jgi:hypothetical protein
MKTNELPRTTIATTLVDNYEVRVCGLVCEHCGHTVRAADFDTRGLGDSSFVVLVCQNLDCAKTLLTIE